MGEGEPRARGRRARPKRVGHLLHQEKTAIQGGLEIGEGGDIGACEWVAPCSTCSHGMEPNFVSTNSDFSF